MRYNSRLPIVVNLINSMFFFKKRRKDTTFFLICQIFC